MDTKIQPDPARGPLGESQRIDSIDVLRGVAVLGILALNIQSFAMPGSAYMNPTSFGNFKGANYWIWYVTHLLGDMKFWSIFSMLFGAGIILTTQRCEETGRSAAGVHYRRMGWLLLIGVLHAYLVWYGDILYTYAMCGLVLYLCRRWPLWALWTTGLVALLISFGVSFGFGALLVSGEIPDLKAELAASWMPSSELIQQELDVYRGTWSTQMPLRAGTAIFFQTFLFLTMFGWRSAGLMLIGMALHRSKVFSASRSNRFYFSLFALGSFIGIPLVAYGVSQNQQHQWSLDYSFYFGPLFNYWGSLLVALGWIGLVMLACKKATLRPLTKPLATAGRMALTCYLLQSLLATTFFYGHGLGQFGRLERGEQFLVVLSIWIVCLLFAHEWLKRFRFGPMEWLWRCLTYWKRQPMKRSAKGRVTD